MKPATRTCAIALVAGLVVFGGCTERKSEQPATTTSAPAQAQPSQSAPAPQPPPAVVLEPKHEPAHPEEQKPAAVTTPQKPAAPAAKKAIARDVVVLTGSPLGGVRFEHKLHATRAANACETCHHASKPEKPATAPQQACSECHTKVAAAPMKTKYQAAFHNPMAQAGTCVDCHKAQNAKGKKAPVKCAECHKKENA